MPAVFGTELVREEVRGRTTVPVQERELGQRFVVERPHDQLGDIATGHLGLEVRCPDDVPGADEIPWPVGVHIMAYVNLEGVWFSIFMLPRF